MYLQAYQRCAFVFRKNSEGKWEIAYLNHSIAYEAVKDNELFAISKGIRNFRKLRTPDISLFSSKDKDTLYHLIEQTSLSLSKKEQEVCTILSLFPRFSKTQAEFICQNTKTMKRLLVHWARNPFMAYEHPKERTLSIPSSASTCRENSRLNPGTGRRTHTCGQPNGNCMKRITAMH